MDSSTSTPASASNRSFGGWLGAMPRWKKVALLAAFATLATGAVLMVVSPGPAATPVPTDPATGQSGLAATLVPDGPRPVAGQPEAAEEPAAKGIFRLGFSFLAGFCLGAFVRAALKLVSIAFGFWLAMTFVLAYYGLVVVDWQAIDAVWNRFCANIETEWADFQRFMTGSLPAAGLAVAGLAIGLKRH